MLGLLTTAKVAAVIGVSASTVQRWHRNGLMPAPAHRSGNRPYWTQKQADTLKMLYSAGTNK